MTRTRSALTCDIRRSLDSVIVYNTSQLFDCMRLRPKIKFTYLLLPKRAAAFQLQCNYILFTKLPWLGNSEGTFRYSSQAATCPPVYHTRRRLYTVPLIAERQAWKL